MTRRTRGLAWNRSSKTWAVPYWMARLLRLLPDAACAHAPGSMDTPEAAFVSLAAVANGQTASRNCAAVACRSSSRRSRPVHQRGFGACHHTQRCSSAAQPYFDVSACPGSTLPQKLNSVEPPWYGPVCPVVWEGRRREASPLSRSTASCVGFGCLWRGTNKYLTVLPAWGSARLVCAQFAMAEA